MNVTLCGLPGCGKSSVGQALAQKGDLTFIDIDLLIQAIYQSQGNKFLNCQEIFAFHGEVFFRQLEKEAIASLVHSQDNIIASGGGAFMQEPNRKVFKSIGKVIYLKGPLKLIFDRLTRNRLPAYLDPQHPFKSFEALAAKRCPIYETVADYIFDMHTLTSDEIASRLLELLSLSKRR